MASRRDASKGHAPAYRDDVDRIRAAMRPGSACLAFGILEVLRRHADRQAGGRVQMTDGDLAAALGSTARKVADVRAVLFRLDILRSIERGRPGKTQTLAVTAFSEVDKNRSRSGAAPEQNRSRTGAVEPQPSTSEPLQESESGAEPEQGRSNSGASTTRTTRTRKTENHPSVLDCGARVRGREAPCRPGGVGSGCLWCQLWDIWAGHLRQDANKQAARRALAVAANKATAEEIAEGARRYARSSPGKVMHLHRWLERERWEERPPQRRPDRPQPSRKVPAEMLAGAHRQESADELAKKAAAAEAMIRKELNVIASSLPADFPKRGAAVRHAGWLQKRDGADLVNGEDFDEFRNALGLDLAAWRSELPEGHDLRAELDALEFRAPGALRAVLGIG